MRYCILLSFFLFVPLLTTASDSDLYRISIENDLQADLLQRIGAQAIHASGNTYLVLLNSQQSGQLEELGLEYQLIAQAVIPGRLAIDWTLNDQASENLEVLYEGGGVRFLTGDDTTLAKAFEVQEVRPLSRLAPRIRYHGETEPIKMPDGGDLVDLEWLISLIEADSLRSYDSVLSIYPDRVMGSPSNTAAGEWLASKFEEFGYDSVMLDPFQSMLHYQWLTCNNVIAYKIGSCFPDRHIVIGAHRDAVEHSPGADDNASGSAGLLELARVLQSVETQVSIVFVLFDAEEYTGDGGIVYVEKAIAEDEDIQFMLNFDMIAYHPPETDRRVGVFGYLNNQYADLFRDLADSLVGLTAVYGELPGYTDQVPFADAGYTAMTISEAILNWGHLHQPSDSMVYLGFDYAAELVRASLALVYAASNSSLPQFSDLVAMPDDLPKLVSSGWETTLEVVGQSWCGFDMVPESLKLHYFINGGLSTEITMVKTGAGRYIGSLPSLDCRDRIEYYFSAVDNTGRYLTDVSPMNPHSAFCAMGVRKVFVDDFETDKGWLTTYQGVTSGYWDRGEPKYCDMNPAAPESDGDGSGQCYQTGIEELFTFPGYEGRCVTNRDVDEGSVSLWSPIIDLTDDKIIEWQYYLYLSKPGMDSMVVELNPEYPTGDWNTIANYTTHYHGWRQQTLKTKDLIEMGIQPTAYSRFRFTVCDFLPGATVEAALDGFKVVELLCQSEQCCGAFGNPGAGNVNCDSNGKRNLSDIIMLIDHVYLSKQPLCCRNEGNVDGDYNNLINLADITRLIDHVYISKEETGLCE